MTDSVRAGALRAFVHPTLTAVTAADWNPDLHPRGHDGKFIDVFGLIDLIDMPGFRHGQRGDKKVQGEVHEIIPDPENPGNPIIRVKMTDPRWDHARLGRRLTLGAIKSRLGKGQRRRFQLRRLI